MELLRREPLLGGNKVIVGSPTEELVLETLGRLYIKQLNSFIDVIECLENLTSSDSDSTYESKVEFTDNIATEDPSVYKDGIFMFDVSSLRLYLVYKSKFRFVTDLKANSESDVFVKRDGSTDMSGTLVIKTTDVPLQVTSKKLVKNLNAELFDSNTTDAFAMKEKNETIKGDYTFNGASEFNGTAKFNNKTTFNRIATFNREAVFNDNSTFNRNIIANGNIRQATGDFITDGSMGSSSFASGFTGHGWRLDANTNTLTIDNLVVRGILSVFELVVNKISATNGSLWVTDSFKVGEVKSVTEVEVEDLGSLDNFFSEPQYEKYYKNDTAKTTEEELTNDDVDEVTEEEGSAETTKEIKSSSFVIFYENSVPASDPSYNADDMNRHIINADTQASYSDLHTIYAYNRDGLNLTAFPYYVYNNFYRINTSSEITGGVAANVTSGELLEYPLYTPTENGVNYKSKLLNSVYTFAPVKVPYVSGQTPNDNVKTASSLSQDATVSYVCSTLVRSYLYFLYFCNNPIFVLYPDDDTNYPNFKIGDLLKCQKFTGKTVKQYNAVVLNTIEDFIVIQIGTGPLDYYTEYEYDAEGNMTSSTSERLVDDLGNYITKFIPEKGDALIRIGNLFDMDRTGSLFLTSSDKFSPYIDTMYGVCRPDYNVSYWEPEYKTTVIPIDGVNKTVYVTDGDDPTGIYYDQEEADFYYNLTPNRTYNLYNTTTLNNTEYIICKLNNYTKARFGRLDGIYNECFGNKLPYGYGLYGENVFLTGEFYLNNGKSVVSFGDDIRLVSASTQLALELVNQNLNGFSLNILNVVSEMNLLRTSTKNIIKNASTLTESNLTDYWNLVGCDTTTYQASDVGYEGLETIQLGNYYVKSAVFRVMDTSLLNTQITILDGTFNLTPSTQYVLSLYVKADLSTEDPDLRNIIFLGASLQSYTITNGINRYYYTFTTASSLDTYVATRLRVLYQVYDDTYGYQGSIPIQIYGTQLEQGSTPTAFEDLGQSATLLVAEEKAKQAATNTLNSEFEDMLLDNTSAFAHAYSTAAKTPDGGTAFAASYALAAGRAGLQLTGVSYNSSTGVQVANSSKIGLIADAIDIKNYIYWDSAEEEYVERIPDSDPGGYLQKIYYTTVSPLPNLNIWNLTANDIHVGWILTYEIPSKTTAVSFPVNVTILDELGESKILSWQYYYENSLGYTIFANDTTGNYPYKPGSAISFLNASAVNFILYTLSAALFENGKIKALHIDVDYLKTLIIDVEELKADLLLAGIIDADNITVRNVVAAPLAYIRNDYKIVFEDGTDVPEEYALLNASHTGILGSVFLENNAYYMYEYSMYISEYNYEYRCSYPTGPDIYGVDGTSGWQSGYYTKYTNFSPFRGYLSNTTGLKQGLLLVSYNGGQSIDYTYNGYYIFDATSYSNIRVSEVKRRKVVMIPIEDVTDKEKVPHVFINGGSGKLEALEATIKNLKGVSITHDASLQLGTMYTEDIYDQNYAINWKMDSGGLLQPVEPFKDFYMLSSSYTYWHDTYHDYYLPNKFNNNIGKEITFVAYADNVNNTTTYVRIKGMFVLPYINCQNYVYDIGLSSFTSMGTLNLLSLNFLAMNTALSEIVITLYPASLIKVVGTPSGWYVISSSGCIIIRGVGGNLAYAYLNGVAWLL